MNESPKPPAAALTALLSTLVISLVMCAQPVEASQKRAPRASARLSATVYSCPMHPEISSRKPGRCPKCGMNLRARAEGLEKTATTAEAGTVNQSTAKNAEEMTTTRLRIPDVAVLDQDGRQLNFYTDLVKGRTVLINFIFTTCTTICPPLTATFRRVQMELGPRAGRDVQLISVSVDPTTDVPERLKAFGEKFKAGPGWTFVTGSRQDIDQLLRALGAFVADKNDHTPMVLVGNDTAQSWTRAYGLASPSALVKLVNEAAARGDALRAISQTNDAKSDETGAAAVAAPAQQTGDKSKTDSPSDAAARYFPNLVLLTQDNKPVHFYDDLLKGKVVMINFMFATCKGVCSPMTANLARVQSYLGDHLGRDVLMISITVDPLMDTPAVLKKYAADHKAMPGWYFLTGEKKNVDWVLYKLGGYVEDKNDHTSVLILGNVETGEWMKMLAMANPTEIADAVTKLLSSKKGE